MRIGLYFGTFNPVHVGHLIIANHMLAYSDLEALWFVVSPRSPFKKGHCLLEVHRRLEMLRLAVADCDGMEVSEVELSLPQPSYTVTTLAHLTGRFPEHSFGLIMGADNLQSLSRWKDYETLLENNTLYVYPRLGFDPGPLTQHPHVRFLQAPVLQISSTQVRQMIREGKNVKPLLPCGVFPFLDRHNCYR